MFKYKVTYSIASTPPDEFGAKGFNLVGDGVWFEFVDGAGTVAFIRANSVSRIDRVG